MNRLLAILCVVLALVPVEHCFGADVNGLASDAILPGRVLLQSEDEDESVDQRIEEEEEEEEEPKEVKTLVKPGIPRTGPTLFYDGDSFLMQVGKPIQVSILPGSEGSKSRPLSVVSLDAAAISVKGSMIDAERNHFQVNIDWKQQNFGDSIKISSIQINMKFQKTNREYALTAMEIVQLHIGGKQIISNPLEVTTKYGYKVIAPLGLAFGCSAPGMFPPAENEIQSDYAIGITLPDVTLQAFGLRNGGSFGPEWGCGEFMSVGLWVGLIISFFFALICYYGFSMLASVQTMDRFDDPKGKTIHVPQTE